MPSSCRIADLGEAEAFFAAHPAMDAIDIIFTNMCGVPRGKRLRRHEVLGVYQHGRYLPGSAAVIDITGRDTEETGLVWEEGDADRLLRPLSGTLVPAPWLGAGAAQFLAGFHELDGQPHDLDPRHVLGRVIDRFRELKLTPVVAVELEFYLVDRERAANGRLRPAAGLRNPHRATDIQVYGLRELEDFKPFFDDLYAACDTQGIPLESAISEYGAGQFEITLRHRADALRACDEAIMYKRLVKGIAVAHGIEATFMAKPMAESAGNGMHLHISMQDGSGENVFASDTPEGSGMLRHMIGGMQATLGDAFAIFAPNANSYRRFKANSYAPVASTWGVNNRTVSFRIPAGPPSSRHVEHRVCGADANPYLAVAAVLAGMHHGLVQRLDPGPAFVGNGYEAECNGPAMPSNWFSAVDRFKGSALMRDYLGNRFVEMYSIVKQTEQERFFGLVPDLDYEWYLRNA